MSSSSPTETLWRRLWRRWVDGPSSVPAPANDPLERARLSFQLQQQEAELQKLRRVVQETQVSLKKTEEERQKWSESLNERELQLEQEKIFSRRSGIVAKDLDGELKKLRREKLKQQRTFEDRVQELLEKLTDVGKGYPAAVSDTGWTPETAKTLALEKSALQEDLREAHQEISVLQDKLETERAERGRLENRLAGSQTNIDEWKTKLKEIESAFWRQKNDIVALKNEKRTQKERIDELQRIVDTSEREAHAQEPWEIPEEVIRLREQVLELQAAGAAQTSSGDVGAPQSNEYLGAMREVASNQAEILNRELKSLKLSFDEARQSWEKERSRLGEQIKADQARLDQEGKTRRNLEDRLIPLTREIEKWRRSHEQTRTEWEEERSVLLANLEKEKSSRTQEADAQRSAGEKIASLLEQAEGLGKTLERERSVWEKERRAWETERAHLEEYRNKEKQKYEKRLEESSRSASVPEPPSGTPLEASPEIERLTAEIDQLLSENASLCDEIQILKRGEGFSEHR